MRIAEVERITGETKVKVKVNLDGTGKSIISTGIGFLDHMIDQIARHGLIDIEIQAAGDHHIDDHHTTEDIGYGFGKCVRDALGESRGIIRYGDALIPMDETLSRVALDLSGRPYLVWKVVFTQTKLGAMDTELFKEWFQAFSISAGCNLHVENIYGINNHHIIESCFKGLARSLRKAIKIEERASTVIPSTKEILSNDGS